LSRLGQNLSTAGWAGITLTAGPLTGFPGWAGAPSLPRLGQRPPAQWLGRLLRPAWVSVAPSPGWAGRQPSPGWAGAPSIPGWAGIPSRPPSPQHPAGPDQEDPPWPGFLPRPLSFSPGWAGLEYSGWAALSALFRPGQARLFLPRPDYSFPG
jgi:hypothetical protein